MTGLFIKAYHYLKKKRGWFFFFSLIVFILLGYWASRINFEEDISKLIPAGEDSEMIRKVLQNVNYSDKIIINVSTDKPGNAEYLKAYADSLNNRLAGNQNIKKLQAKVNEEEMSGLLDFVSAHLPLYLDEKDYIQIDSMLTEEKVSQTVEEAYRSIVSPSGLITARMIRSDPFGLDFMALKKFRQIQSGNNFTIDNGYLVHQSGKNLFVVLAPQAPANETSRNKILIDKLGQTIQELNQDFSVHDVRAGYFGATPVAVANAERIKSDIILTISISLILLFGLFFYFYRKIHIPFIILVPAIFGSMLGIAVLYCMKGTISSISIGIGSVLLGLTLDYSLHILSHYRSTGDIRKLFISTVKPLLICAVFTAADFLCLLFLKSDVLKDLGIFAAVSVLGAAGFALIFIPQVYKPGREFKTKQNTLIDRLAGYNFSKNKYLLALSLILIVISLFTYSNVGFENNLNKLNYMPEDLKQAEADLDRLNNYSAKTVYLASYGKTPSGAIQANTKMFRQLSRLKSEKEILGFSSVGEILLSEAEQQKKLARWNRFWSPEKKEFLKDLLIREGGKFGFKENTFLPFLNRLDASYQPEKLYENEILKNLFLEDFLKDGNGVITLTSSLKTKKPERVIPALSGRENTLVIDRKQLQETFLSNLEADFNRLFFISSIVIFVILYLFFGSLVLTLITNIPIFAGWLVTLGMMGAWGLDFNAFNIIITTLIFGLGVDYSIFVTRGLIEKYTYGTDEMPAFKSGILMSAIATVLCFGVLVFAKHPAIYSISWIPVIGLSVVVLMSFTIQPWLFVFFIQKPQDKGNTPRTIFNLVMTFFTFGYFFIVGFILNLSARLLIPLIPVSKKKKFGVFHRVMQKYFWLLVYGTPFVPVRIIGKENMRFDSPKIIIANHSSQLDTPTLGMLHKKAIFMVNSRVLNSKFFGKAIQMAGFYKSSENYETEIQNLKEKVRQGYSIIIFPEGTRSLTSAVQRFHKGAFYLSEKLRLNIQPVLVLGNSDLLPKNDNLLKTGNLTLEFLPEIKFDDESWGKNYTERTKKISRYFKKKFIELKRKTESENHFKNKLKFNYIYKPRQIRLAARNEFETHKKLYHRILGFLPVKAKIFHAGCQYGVLDFLLVYDSSLRTVLGWDNDSEKTEIARNTFTVNRFPVRFTSHFPSEIHVFDYIIVQNPSEFKRFEAKMNPNEWELVFNENECRIFKNKNGGGI